MVDSMSTALTSMVPRMSAWPRTKICGISEPVKRSVVPSGSTKSVK